MFTHLDEIERLIDFGNRARTQNDLHGALTFYLRAGKRVVRHLWGFQTSQKVRSLFSCDINGDGQEEILIGSEDCKIYVVDSQGNELWSYQVGNWVMGVAAADIDRDGNIEIIAGADKLYIFTPDGGLKQTIDIPDCVSSLWLGQLAQRGDLSIVTGHDNGLVMVWNHEGALEWQYKTPRRVICVLAEDVDGDDRIEVVVGSEDRQVYILDEIGDLEDVFQVNHWIFNIATCDIGEDAPKRLFIGVFGGDIHIYKHYKERDSRTLRIRQHGILSFAVQQLLPNLKDPQFIIGSSDRAVSVLDFQGNQIWRFEVGYGHRVLIAQPSPDGTTVRIVVGAELRGTQAYTVHLVPGLVDAIRETFERLGIRSFAALDLPGELVRLLRTFVFLDPIVREANLANVKAALDDYRLEEAISLGMELWWNEVEFRWFYKTGGRIYALSTCDLNGDGRISVLAGSEDGYLHVINAVDGKPSWSFQAKAGVRGVHAARLQESVERAEIALASVDGNVYLLDHDGLPKWSFQTEEWALYTYASDIDGDGEKEILVGSDDHGIYALRRNGQMMWRAETDDRVRAVTACDVNNDGRIEVVAGSDDKWVYVIGQRGELKHRFETPHWVLVIHARDVDNDGKAEILVGTEDGHLYVYESTGKLKWQFRAGHWIAALGVYVNPVTGQCEIVVGSADRYVYGLDSVGTLLWQYETGARVRTLLPAEVDQDGHMEILFGSYDQCIYMLSRFDPKLLEKAFERMREQAQRTDPNTWDRLLGSRKDPIRAFAYLNMRDATVLEKGVKDESEQVRAAVGYALLESASLSEEQTMDLIARLLGDSSSRVRTIVHSKLRRLEDTQVSTILDCLEQSLIYATSAEAQIQVLKHARSLLASKGARLLAFAARLVPAPDPWLLDEIRRTCESILDETSDYSDLDMMPQVTGSLSQALEPSYPCLASRLSRLAEEAENK